MVVSNHTFEQMLDMIKVNDILGYKVTQNEGKNYGYLRVLNERLRKKVKPNHAIDFYTRNAFTLGLENAFVNGNKEDYSLPVSLCAFIGEKGLVVRIEDSGEGFDFKEIQKKYVAGESYFKNRGLGFEYYNKEEYLVSFENKGTTLNISYFFNQKEIQKFASMFKK